MAKRSSHKVQRRPVIVLAGLLGAMTLASAYLLMLEPGPVLSPVRVISLHAAAAQQPAATDLFDTAAALRPWRQIVIYQTPAAQARETASPR